jgi:hypothetical protein
MRKKVGENFGYTQDIVPKLFSRPVMWGEAGAWKFFLLKI